ncbi:MULTISPECIES: DUF6090 family protein [Winogradskyella]|uniref:Uncharacterized protein n=1 Tax=Winogradskyella ouciana TaxID=2608631 RepID=A0A7K1GH73_9FLAO|nr:DUF6090 family protein [Winogradskyella ouciana]MTE27864.1 hypothetical protein [Winogradskyella ouciana]
MIKFFRHIRQSMINQNRTKKYLLYAIGEIILLVIGILIALSLNGWKEKNELKTQELNTLKQLKEEFKANLEQLDEKISMRTAMIHSGTTLLKYHDNPNLSNLDSVAIYLARSSVSPTFDPITNDLISGGRLYLIQNLELRSKLSKWPSDLVQVTEEEVAWIFILRNTYMPFLYENYPVRDLNAAKWNKLDVVQTLLLDKNNTTTKDFGQSKHPFDVKAFLANPKLADQLSTVISSSMFAKIQSEALRKDIVSIIKLIDKELQDD